MLEATVVFIFKNGKVLLGYKTQKYCAGRLVGPGGKRRPSETIRRCAGRETKEECGLIPKRVQLLGTVMCHNDSNMSDVLVYMYRADAFVGKLRDSKTLKNIRWHRVSQDTISKMMEGDRTWFDHIVNGTRFKAEVRYNKQWHLIRHRVQAA